MTILAHLLALSVAVLGAHPVTVPRMGETFHPKARAGRITEIARLGAYESIDGPWIMRHNGRLVMYRCHNSSNHDRIWRSESMDGLTWTDDRVVIEGEVDAQDDLSCSPGVVVARDGVWHMYYLTAARQSSCKVEMWHSTSFDGYAWTKLGKIAAVPTSNCSLLTPSPILEGDQIAVYFVVDWYGRSRLFRMYSDDGHAFAPLSPIGKVGRSHHGRVSREDGVYHFVYSNPPLGVDTQPTEVRHSFGPTPDFDDGQLVVTTAPGTFYSTYVSGSNFIEGKIYLIGNYLPACGPEGYVPGVCHDYFSAWGVWRRP